jgi:hypothetical protein
VAFGNLNFETAGGAAGYASLWHVGVVSSVEEIETYGPDPREPWEDFDRGHSNDDYLTLFTWPVGTYSPDLQAAMFDGGVQELEDFEEDWGNDPYETQFSTGDVQAALFDTGTESAEDFEEDWTGLSTYKTFFVFPVGTYSVDLQAALFDTGTESAEDFEEDWTGLSTYKTAFVLPVGTFAGDVSPASFDSGGVAEDFEDFNEVPTEYAFTAVAATDVITCAGHPYTNGQQVMLRSSGGHLPGGLDDETTYFIISAAVGTFSLALTDGGSVVNITSTGAGTHYVRLIDETAYWTTLLLGV